MAGRWAMDLSEEGGRSARACGRVAAVLLQSVRAGLLRSSALRGRCQLVSVPLRGKVAALPFAVGSRGHNAVKSLLSSFTFVLQCSPVRLRKKVSSSFQSLLRKLSWQGVALHSGRSVRSVFTKCAGSSFHTRTKPNTERCSKELCEPSQRSCSCFWCAAVALRVAGLFSRTAAGSKSAQRSGCAFWWTQR